MSSPSLMLTLSGGAKVIDGHDDNNDGHDNNDDGHDDGGDDTIER